MHILVSNDDGYLAEGIRKLNAALAGLARTTVMAPDRNRSGASNSLTLDVPLRVFQSEPGVHYVAGGTPTDCVHIAISGYFDFEFDLVCSGINDGANLGDDTLYSGTVAAATEGYLFGIPAIAFSQGAFGWEHIDAAARHARDIIVQYMETLPAPYLLNVNIPNLPYEQLLPPVATRLGRRHQAEPVIRAQDPRGKEIFWIGPPGATKDAGEGTDFYACANGRTSITPLQIDLTHKTQLDVLAKVLA